MTSNLLPEAHTGKLVEKAEVVSPAGSSVVIKRLRLTDAGRRILSTTSEGIMAGVDATRMPAPHVKAA